MYIDDQKLSKKDPMAHLMEELNIETEIIDPEILIAENANILKEIQTLKSDYSDMSKQLTHLRSKRRDQRKDKYGSSLSGNRIDN